ncbi:ImmA/IrrE family metallo-endopeptidase [Photobacterium damselae]
MVIETEKKIALSELRDIDSAKALLELVYGDIHQLEPPIDVNKIALSISNLKVSEDLDSPNFDKAGFIKVNRDSSNRIQDISIWANPVEPEVRRRFTKAHELGHLVYDVFPAITDSTINEEFIDTLNRKEGSRSFRETRANRFAAQLLMPSFLIKKELNLLIKTLKSENKKVSINDVINHLCSKFDTSFDAMRIRLESLNIIK